MVTKFYYFHIEWQQNLSFRCIYIIYIDRLPSQQIKLNDIIFL